MKKYLILSGMILCAVLAAWSCDDEDVTPTNISVKETETFTATLSGANEVPPVTTTATGTATITVVPGGLLVYRIDVVGLDSPRLAHIHAPAPAGMNIGVKVNFCTQAAPYPICPTGTAFTGVLTAGVATQIPGFSFDSLLVLMRNGNAYVNVHTVVNGGGEIRGQVVRVP